MSQTLLTLPTPETAIETEAANSRFFNVQTLEQEAIGINPFHRLSAHFLLFNQDLLPENYGIVFQAGVTREGEVFDLHGDEKPKTDYAITTIGFDARNHEKTGYKWQLVYAPSYAGTGNVEITELTALPGDTVTQYHKYPSVAAFTSRPAIKEIEILTGSQWFKKYAEELRTRKVRAEAELHRFWQSGVSKYPEVRFDAEIKKREERIQAIGFVALGFHKMPEPQDTTTLPPYQGRLFYEQPGAK